ncbi:hypothetical protein ACQEUU_11040 [Nonomuraea sp. CA-218870]|uniref:hypothetical protein n=1 Tax=Nonomuraea sp. CA-218870 TaxID=3239998 RepID=UPI003D8ABBC0
MIRDATRLAEAAGVVATAVGGTSWAAQHPVLMAVLWPLALTAVFAVLSVRTYQRLDR